MACRKGAACQAWAVGHGDQIDQTAGSTPRCGLCPCSEPLRACTRICEHASLALPPVPAAAATEVEAVLHQHPAVYQAAVFGLPSRVMGELVGAAVTLRPDAQASRWQAEPR